MRYYRDGFLRKLPEIMERLGYSAERFYEGRLLVPGKRVVAVDFGASGADFIYKAGYPDSVVREAYRLLLQGASESAAGRILGVSMYTIRRWRKSAGLKVKSKPAKIVKGYPRITEFSENALRQAALHNMSPDEAARVSGLKECTVKVFWRKIGHNLIPPNTQEVVLARAKLGLPVTDICRGTEFTYADFKNYYLATTGVQYKATKVSRSGSPEILHKIVATVDELSRLKGYATSRDVSVFRRTSLQAASITLKHAWRDGLLQRKKDGFIFLYYPVARQESAAD